MSALARGEHETIWLAGVFWNASCCPVNNHLCFKKKATHLGGETKIRTLRKGPFLCEVNFRPDFREWHWFAHPLEKRRYLDQ